MKTGITIIADVSAESIINDECKKRLYLES